MRAEWGKQKRRISCYNHTSGLSKGASAVRFRLIPREEKFYEDFLAAADNLVAAAKLLDEMLSSDPPSVGKAAEIKELEHRCDYLTHEIFQRLHKTFVTPIDREDIHALASSLDDVMDAIDAAAHLFEQYKITTLRDGVRHFSRIIVIACEQIRLALHHMKQHEAVTPSVVEINRLENEADRVHQEVISALFVDEKDPITLIKWKEIFDYLEGAVDSIEDVSDVIQGVVLKHA
jgi:predicted phosphate transport protein (TIGR00153 family)